jgi:hypothetical protein
MYTPVRIAFVVATCAGMACAQAAAPLEHFGMCDASAAVAIGGDRFLVANDEDNILRLYRRDISGPALDPVYDESETLRLPGAKKKKDGTEREADLEGAAQIGQRVYWIGSHGANSDAEFKPERRQLFATDLDDKNGALSVAIFGKPYTGLLEAMAAHPPMKKYDLLKAATIAPEKKGGLNIEGLAATPDNHLLIGFRGPLHRDKALLLPLLNPAELVAPTSGAAPKPQFGDPVELDLGGRGIRSIGYAARLRAYLIVAGPHGKKGDFKLYKWTGAAASPPLLLPVEIGDSLRPEALFALADGKSFQLLSDDGDEKIHGVACKESEPPGQRKFRSIVITLP